MKLNRIFTVARFTLIEAIRAKVLIAVAVATVAALGMIFVVAQISVGAGQRVMSDLGASAILYIAVAQTLAVSISMVFKEYERRTLFPLLSTPLGRTEYQVGKFFGLLFTSALSLLVISLVYWSLTWAAGAAKYTLFLLPLPLLMELSVLIAGVMFFAAFATPAMTAVFSIGLFLLGHAIWGVETLTQYNDSRAAQWLVALAEMGIPALQVFNFNEQLLHGPHPGPGAWGFAVLYAVLWCVVLLAASAMFFEKREIT
jgi:ABC-type transport system involved in multi-copper enzyme maturation permease subunit